MNEEKKIIEKRINKIPEWAFEFARMTHVDAWWIEFVYCLACDTVNPKPIAIITRNENNN